MVLLCDVRLRSEQPQKDLSKSCHKNGLHSGHINNLVCFSILLAFEHINCMASSSSSSTVPSSGDTVPTTQEVCPSQDQEDHANAKPESWGALYPIDSRFYPIELQEDIYTFGRDDDCSYSFNIPSIKNTSYFKQYSKQHFTIQRTSNSSHGHTVLLIDTSMNGVFVNGEKLPQKSSRQLCSKDEVSIAVDKNRVFFFFDKTKEEDPNLPKSFSDKYIMHKMIGSGAYGEVRIAMSKFGVEQHAVKIINKQKTIFGSKDPDKAYDQILKEAKLMLSFQHPFIVTVHDVLDSPQKLYIILELAPGGDLYTRVLKKNWLGDQISKLLFFQMASAVAYLHDRNVSHRDLKPENILMMSEDDNCLIKITDFGVSRLLEETSFMNTQAGTPSYLAPELINTIKGLNRGYTKQIDSWSLGVILYVCLVGYPPFLRDRKDTDQDLLQQILTGNYNFNHPRWSHISNEAKDLVNKMLEVNPDKRLTPSQCSHHAWLNDEAMRLKVKGLMPEISITSSTPCDLDFINQIENELIASHAVAINFQSPCIDEIGSSSTSVSGGERRICKRSRENQSADCDVEKKRFAGVFDDCDIPTPVTCTK